MDALPLELVYAILERVDGAARPILCHVNSDWRAVVGKLRTSREITMTQSTKQIVVVVGGHASDAHDCRSKHDCIVHYTRVLIGRRWDTLLQWVLTKVRLPKRNQRRLGAYACNRAALDGDLERLGTLFRYPCGTETPVYAARAGHIHVLEWLHRRQQTRCAWDERTCTAAAEHGHLDVLQWLRERACPWSAKTCAGAGLCGNLEMLRWLRINGCPWDTRTCECAAARGHLSVLRWAKQNGCPWGTKTSCLAATNGHVETFQWLEANGCPGTHSWRLGSVVVPVSPLLN